MLILIRVKAKVERGRGWVYRVVVGIERKVYLPDLSLVAIVLATWAFQN